MEKRVITFCQKTEIFFLVEDKPRSLQLTKQLIKYLGNLRGLRE